MSEKTELTAADLALYLGCEVLVHYAPSTERIGQLREVGQNGSWVRFELHTSAYKSHEIKPILRPLSDMTEEEYMEVQYRVDKIGLGYDAQQGAEITRYLLSKHFDLFGWIPAGLALDKTKIQ